MSDLEQTFGPAWGTGKPATLAWNEIEKQLQTENASDLGVVAAKNAFIESFSNLTRNITGVSAEEALLSAKQYVLAGSTVAGSVRAIEGLVSAGSAPGGVVPGDVIKIFTGSMVGAMGAAGAVSAGIGAAIVGGVGIIVDLLDNAGLFGSRQQPRGVEIPGCPGYRCDPPPAFAVGCVCAWADLPVPGSEDWRKFPSEVLPEDGEWFKQRSCSNCGQISFQWKRGKWSTSDGGRAIDRAFGAYWRLECENKNSLPGMMGDFQRAFFEAWKMNQAYALNGRKPAEDWRVFAQTVRMWNNSHDAGDGYDMVEAPSGELRNYSEFGLFTPYVSGGMAWQIRVNGGCSITKNDPLYEQYLVSDLIKGMQQEPRERTFGVGRRVRIHTGPLKKIKPIMLRNGLLQELGLDTAATTSTTSVASKIVVGTAVTGAIGAGAVYLYARSTGMTFIQAAKHLFKRGKSAVGLYENVYEENPFARGRARVAAAKQAWMRAFSEAAVRLGRHPGQLDWGSADYLHGEGYSPEAAAQKIYGIKSNPRSRARRRY